MAPKPFRAVIVGGGVGGLTLANILEQLGIDYVLLEAYREFCPEAGASISMLPGGQRILSQIGCKESYVKGVPALNTTKPILNGKPILIFRGYDDSMVKRTGHGVAFNHRQALLQSLYDNVKDKSKLLLNKRVSKVTTTEAGASVETKDGDVFEGDIIVGLDGIRSTVREEMWRIAAQASPGYFPKDEWKRVQIPVKCLYAICRSHKKVPPGTTFSVMGLGHTYLVIGGMGGAVYFFLFKNLPEPITADKTPRYTAEDARALAEEHRNDVIIDDCTFGQIFDASDSLGMTPVHEHVFERWHYGRIVTLGDAAHKPNPISGQGGNGAIESVAELANQLKRRLDSPSSPGRRLSAADVDAVFRDTQAVRHERAKRFVNFSHEQQAFNAPSGALGLLRLRLAPWIVSEETLLEAHLGMAIDAVRVDGLPMPFEPHFNPWTDELPAKPIRGSWIPGAVVGLAMLALSYAAGYGVGRPGDLPASFLGHPFRKFFTGHQPTDRFLTLLTQLFSLVIGSRSPETRLQATYFLPLLTPAVLIWVVEANRRGNLKTPLGRSVTWPSIYAIAYQMFSIARVGPIYFLVSLLVGRSAVYHRQASRVVDEDVARALLPAVFLGYVVPTVCMLLPLWAAPATWLDVMTLWQLAPVVVGPLTSLLASRGRKETAKKASSSAAEEAADDDGGVRVVGEVGNSALYDNRDLPHLLTAYAVTFAGAAAVHVAVMLYLLLGAGPASASVRTVFFDLPCWPWSAAATTWRVGASGAKLMSVLFRWDLIIYAATLLVWCLHTVVEMRRVGFVRTVDACKAAAAVAASFVLVGPGAMYAGTWYWREKTIAGLSKMEEGDVKKTQ